MIVLIQSLVKLFFCWRLQIFMYMNILLGQDRVGLVHLHYDKFGILPDISMGALKTNKNKLNWLFLFFGIRINV